MGELQKKAKFPTILFGALLFLCWGIFLLFGDSLIGAAYSGGIGGFLRIVNYSETAHAVGYYKTLIFQFLALITLAYFLVLIIWHFRGQLKDRFSGTGGKAGLSKFQTGLLQFSILATCSWACFFCLINQGVEGSWYVIGDLMNYHGNAPFQQRALFLLEAKFIKILIPSLAYKYVFYASQVIPILLSFYLIRKWSELFVPVLYSFLAPIILLAMLVPTIYYYNFYDFGIVMFFTLALYLLFKKKTLWYYPVFILGVLNHEVMLFAVFMYAAIFWKGSARKLSFWVSIAAQLLIFVGLRYAVYHIFPAERMFESGRFWTNIETILTHPQGLLNTGITLAGWYLLAIFGLGHAPDALRRIFYLFPLFFMIMFVFGKLNEVRLFNPYIPVVIALIMLLVKSLVSRIPQEKREAINT